MGLPRIAVFLLAAGLTLFSCEASPIPGTRISPVQISSGQRHAFVDEFGRERFFHGVNVVYKSFPYLPVIDYFDGELSLAAEDLQYLDDWGINCIRLGVMWPGVEPERGQINQTYIAQVQSIVNEASKHGIYTILDAHQDLFNEAFCGEGVPQFAATATPLPTGLKTFPRPLQLHAFEVNGKGIPSREDCARHQWASYYFTFALSASFQAFYDNINGIADAFADHWARIAGAFKGEPAVLGIEILNEPWAGDIYSHPLYMYPPHADRDNLQPLYDRVAARIRAVDPTQLVMFETVTWADPPGGAFISECGLTAAPGGPEHDSTSVYAYHYYNPPNFGNPGDYFDRRQADADRLGVASFVTEFSLDERSADTMDLLDKRLLSWTAWEYKRFAGSLSNGTCTGCGFGPFHANGTVNEAIAGVLIRPYAQAIAGKTLRNEFCSKTGVLLLQFRMDTSISAPTVVYIGEAMHNGDYANVEIEPVGLASWTTAPPHKGSHRLFIRPSKVAKSGDVITLRIMPPDSVAFV